MAFHLDSASQTCPTTTLSFIIAQNLYVFSFQGKYVLLKASLSLLTDFRAR